MKLSNKQIFEGIVFEIEKVTCAFLESVKLSFSAYYSIENNRIVRNTIHFLDYHHSYKTPKKIKNKDIDALNKYKDSLSFSFHFVCVGIESNDKYRVLRGNIFERLTLQKDIYLDYTAAETALLERLEKLESVVSYLKKNRVPPVYDFEANGYKSLGLGNMGAKETKEYKECSEANHPYMELAGKNEYIVYCPCCKIYYGAFSDD